jgi:alkylglycerol monooxygenase
MRSARESGEQVRYRARVEMISSAPGRSVAGASPRWLLDGVFLAGAVVATLWNGLGSGHASVASKLVPMGALIAMLALRLRAGEVDRAMAIPLLFGLAASAVGDVVIAYVFVGGIAAFLVAHLAYLAAMRLPRGRAPAHAAAALPAIAIGGSMGWLLVAGGRVPAPLLVPVAVYMTILSAMLARATGRAFVGSRSPESRLLAAGAAMFVLSDSIIALSRWVMDIPYPKLAILATYFAAQRLIVAGADRAPEGRPPPAG